MELNIHKSHLLEVSRKDLVAKSRVQSKKRYQKRLNYQVSNFRGVDLKQMFENDYFVFKTPIKDYVCVIAFPGVFTQLRQVVKTTHGDVKRINLQMVIKALRRAFDATDDIKVDCTCADWRYRFAYWATQNGYKYGDPENRPSEITNPDDAIGSTCKHLNLLLSNKRWLTKAASVVNSFIKTYPDKAALYLYDEDEIVKDEVPEKEKSRPRKEPEKKEEPPRRDNKDEEVPEETDSGNEDPRNDEDEEGPEETVTDSLKLTESNLITSDEEFLDTSDVTRSWIPEQRQKLSEIKNRILSYAKKLDLENRIDFLGYRKYSRRENTSQYLARDKEGREVKFWITYDGRYNYVDSIGLVKRSNKDPQKIVKYIFDELIY